MVLYDNLSHGAHSWFHLIFTVPQVKQTRSSSGVGGGGETAGGETGRVRGSARGGPLLRTQVASARHLERLMAARNAARLTHGDLQHQVPIPYANLSRAWLD